MSKFSVIHFALSGIVALLMVSCAGTRTPIEPLPEGCAPKVVRDGEIPSRSEDALTRNTPKFGTCHTEGSMMLEAAREACHGNYQGVSLINVVPGDFFSSPCFRADFALYRDSSGLTQSAEPVIKIDTMSLEGFMLFIHPQFGGVVSGEQSEHGLRSEKGDKASTDKVGMLFGGRYFINPNVAVDLEAGYVGTSASAPQTKSMGLFSGWGSNLGISLVPWNHQSIEKLWFFSLSGGLNYTRISIDNDLAKFMADDGYIANNDVASGFGWYAGFEFNNINRHNIQSGIGIRFLQENPEFPSASKSMDANSILLTFTLGYNFQ